MKRLVSYIVIGVGVLLLLSGLKDTDAIGVKKQLSYCDIQVKKTLGKIKGSGLLH